MMTLVQWSLLIGLLATAVSYDVATRRIPNWLVCVSLLTALTCSSNGATSLDFTASLLGAVTGLLVLLPFYVLRVMGAGDVKLLGAVGALLGPIPTLGAALLALAAGGALSVMAALGSRSLLRVVANLRLMLFVFAAGKSSGMSVTDVNTTGRLPYAVAIAAGTGLQLWLAARGGWLFA